MSAFKSESCFFCFVLFSPMITNPFFTLEASGQLKNTNSWPYLQNLFHWYDVKAMHHHCIKNNNKAI